MKILLVPLLALIGVGFASRQAAGPAQLHAASHTAASSQAKPAQGSLMGVHTHGTRSIITLRGIGDRLTDYPVSSSSRIVARDGHQLAVSALRSGDHLLVYPNGQIEDLSQRTVTVSGVVAYDVDPGTSIALSLPGRPQNILADISHSTRFADTTRTTSTIDTVEDADQVRIHGVLNSNVGEMTQTDSVTRVGPLRCRQTNSSSGRCK
jgi:hypothetical protein